MHPRIPLRQQWFGNVRGDVLAGLVVALALIPEAIAFSIIAGVLKLASLTPGSSVVMAATHDLAKGVLTGMLLSALFFARHVGRLLDVEDSIDADGTRRYVVRGQVFFASANAFGDAFDLLEPVPRVVIDLTHAHF